MYLSAAFILEEGLPLDDLKRIAESMRDACAQAFRWAGDHPGGLQLPVYVNLSARQLADANFVDEVQEVIDLTGVDPTVVHFEITEHAPPPLNAPCVCCISLQA